MKIGQSDDLHCDAGWRNFSFLKVTTDDGIIGWSEYNESYGSKGLTGVIKALGETLIGEAPRPFERIASRLYATTRPAPGGLNSPAIAPVRDAPIHIQATAPG